MRTLLIILSAMLTFGTVWADESPDRLTDRLFSTDNLQLDLMRNSLNPTVSSSAGQNPTKGASDTQPAKLNAGKALILSAVLPGAGEYYAGAKIRAAVFFGIEVAAWTAVVYYYNAGQQKDKDFKKYADQHFFEEVYRTKEYSLAQQPQYGDSGAFKGTEPEWRVKTWDEKIHFLPSEGFTHNLPTNDERVSNSSEDQQYYEMIGKYIHQFGFGWDDVFLGPTGPFKGDDPGTPEYDDADGAAAKSVYYMGMRYDSNQLLERSAIATQIALLNHVASALDASFAVRAINKQAEAQVGFHAIQYGEHLVTVGGLNLKW